MQLRFWGVRGSVAVPGAATLEFGGNTSCVELEGARDVILFDAGTGIREAGLSIAARGASRIHLFLTHFHWDHIQGIPFFAPLFLANVHVTIYSSVYSAPLRESLEASMAVPFFPIGFETFAARVDFVDLGVGSANIDGVVVRPFEVNHPQGACAYDVQCGGPRFIYAPDREHGDANLDATFLEAARGATVLVISSQYTPEEYETHRGWGHSTWLESTRVARAAGVDSLVLFHHDPLHSDEMLRRIEQEARRKFADTFMAKEGWAFEL
ncbi:MAG: MBL fold metallo-hydrolase [Bryobacteraceae bacterium]